MKRFDLRHYGSDFYDRMRELLDVSLEYGEVGIFIFERVDHDSVQKSADLVKCMGFTLMNSLQFNRVDWTIVVKKT